MYSFNIKYILSNIPERLCRILTIIIIATADTSIPKAKVPIKPPIVCGSEQHKSSFLFKCEGSGIVTKNETQMRY